MLLWKEAVVADRATPQLHHSLTSAWVRDAEGKAGRNRKCPSSSQQGFAAKVTTLRFEMERLAHELNQYKGQKNLLNL